MSWRSYNFEDLPELSREDVRARREILRLLPGPDAGRQLRWALGQSLQRLQRPEQGPLTTPIAQPIHGIRKHDDASSTKLGAFAPGSADAPGSAREPAAAPDGDPESTSPRPGSPLGSVGSHSPSSAPGAASPAPVALPLAHLATSRPAEELVYIRRHGPAKTDGWRGGAHPVRVRLGLGQKNLVAVVELPLASARSIVGAVVEVSPERLGASDLLTHVEQGILAFFAERVATGMTERVAFLAPLMPVTIEDIVCENREIDWGAEGPEGWYSVTAVAQLAGLSLPFRLLLPWAALALARRSGDISPGDEARQRRERDRWFGTLGDAPVRLGALLGHAEITARDLRQLESTDILLFEARDFDWVDGRIGGHLSLAHLEDGTVRIETEVVSDQGHLQLRVRSLVAGTAARIEEGQEVTQDHRPSDGMGGPSGPDPESTQPPEAQATGAAAAGRSAAEDAPIQLRIELGRLRLSLRELAQLTPGTILEMRRDPTAPVSLVVEDRVIGTGDLVRVEGELGVRIASLV